MSDGTCGKQNKGLKKSRKPPHKKFFKRTMKDKHPIFSLQILEVENRSVGSGSASLMASGSEPAHQVTQLSGDGGNITFN